MVTMTHNTFFTANEQRDFNPTQTQMENVHPLTPFHFTMVVWRDEYVDMFLKIALPTQLSSNNLEFFRTRKHAQYKLYTMRKDAEHITKSPVFQKLEDILAVEILFIDDILNRKEDADAHKHNLMNECHRHAIVDADAEKAAIVFTLADTIFSDGSFKRFAELADAGKGAVMCYGPRLLKESFMREFQQKYYQEDTCIATISSRQLARLCIDHFHPVSESLCWDSEKSFNQSPTVLHWKVGKDGILARTFHPGPLMVNAKKRGLLPNETIDADYVVQACPDIDDLHFVQNSDELFVVSLTSKADQMAKTVTPPVRSKLQRTLAWAHTSSYQHRVNLHHKLRIHATEISDEWLEVEKASDKVVDTILFLLTFYIQEKEYLSNPPLAGKRISLPEGSPLRLSIKSLLQRDNLEDITAPGYPYSANMRLGIEGTEEYFIHPSESMIALTKELIDFGNRKPIIAINPFSSSPQRTLPFQPILEFILKNQNDYNFVITGSVYGRQTRKYLHAYWAWEYYSFSKMIQTLPFVRNCVGANIVVSYTIPMLVDYFITTASGLSNLVMNRYHTPTIAFAPLLESSSGHTAPSSGVIVNCDLLWGFTADTLQRHFTHLQNDEYGPTVCRPYTALKEGLTPELYVKKLLWQQVCALAFDASSYVLSDIKDPEEWDDAPFMDDPLIGIDVPQVCKVLDLLWDLDAEIFRYDSNPAIFYSALLIRKAKYAKVEAVLEKLRHYFVLNPFLLNNLAIAKWHLGKAADATHLIDQANTQTSRCSKRVFYNYESLSTKSNRELKLFYFKPHVYTSYTINPERDFGKLDDIVDELVFCQKIVGEGKVIKRKEKVERSAPSFGNDSVVMFKSESNGMKL